MTTDSNALTKVNSKSPWTEAQIKLIRDTVAKGATADELKLFLYTASRTGLDPLTKQIHCVKRWDSKLGREAMTVQTGIDGYRAIAERTGTLAGIDDPIYDSEEGKNPNKATVTVHRFVKGQKVSFTASARWNEYVQKYKDKNTGAEKVGTMWEKMPYLMLGKCAEALALRKAFPNDLSGIYTHEEMSQADNTAIKVELDKGTEVVTEPVENSQSEHEYVAESQEKEFGVPPQPRHINDTTLITCPICKKEHRGRYPKCLDCWKKEGTVGKAKSAANEQIEPPF